METTERQPILAPEDLEQWSDVYRKTLKHLADVGRRRLLNQGILPGCPPVGYNNERRFGRTFIVVDPEQCGHVMTAFEWADKKELSIRELLARLTERGLRSRTGKVMGPSALWHLLTNPFYTGVITYDGAVYKGAHSALVSKKRFARVQQKLGTRRRSGHGIQVARQRLATEAARFQS